MKNTLLKPLGGLRIAALVLAAAVLICSAAVVSSQHFFASQTQATPRPSTTAKLSFSSSPEATPSAQASSSPNSFLPSATPAAVTTPSSTLNAEPSPSPTSTPSTSVVPWGSVISVFDPSQSSANASNQSSATQSGQLYEASPLFDVQVIYAYAGPRVNDYYAPGLLPNQTLSGSLYPALVCLNVTLVSNATVQACDGAIEVYRVQVTTDTKVSESYTFTAGTSFGPGFNPQVLSTLSDNIESLMGGPMVNGGSGYFNANLSIGSSISGVRVGSLGNYESGSADLGFWSDGQPNNVTVSVYRLGCILMTGFAGFNYYSNSQAPTMQVQLAKYGEGFLFNLVVPQNQLPADPFNPPI